MRYVIAFTLALFALAALPMVFADQCGSATSCEACTNTTSCGWCSDWNGCMAGNWLGPFSGVCKDWHPDSCVGVSIPRATKCSGSPMSMSRIRQLMGAGGSFASLNSAAKWTVQTRTCNPVTGCTNWDFTTADAPVTNVTLQVESGVVFLNLITSTCTTPSGKGCFSSSGSWLWGALKFFQGSPYFGLETSDVGKPALSFALNGLPLVKCSTGPGGYCATNAWTAPGGSFSFVFSGELTDNCLHISGVDKTEPKTAYIDLYMNF